LLKLEKWVIGIILFFLIIIASFSIITSSITTINEDSKKIALLRTLGMRLKDIYIVYLLRIIVIGIISIVIGLVCGYVIAQLISHQNLIKMNGEVYLLDAFHVSITFPTLMIIFVTSLMRVTLSAMIALKQIFKLDIISILRMKK
jgi:lipoprotein-releasing system permease protein